MDSISFGQYLVRTAGLRGTINQAYLTNIAQAAKDMGMHEDALYRINSPSIVRQLAEQLKNAHKFSERPKRKQQDMLTAMANLAEFAEFRKQSPQSV